MIRIHRIATQSLSVAAAAALMVSAQLAFAGAPLKGVGVSLGKSPGGSVARTTGPDGKADFGVLPKGNYTITLDPPHPLTGSNSALATGRVAAQSVAPPAKLHVVITGAASGTIERDIGTAQSSERATPLRFSVDGAQRLVVAVSAGD